MVSIIIISYNTEKLLNDCLTSLYTHLKKFSFEVIVVDNDSHDTSVAMVKKNFPKTIILDTKKNPGFGTANNTGAAMAHGDTLLFLNSDTEVFDSSIAEMEKFLNSDEKIGVVGGALLNPDKTAQRSFNHFYDVSHTAQLLFGGDKKELASQDLSKTQKVDWVSGGFLMIKKDVFGKINGFDENIFMYLEDMELCYRVHKEKFDVYFYPKARVIHIGHGSSNRTFAIVNIYRGLLYVCKKHYSKSQYAAVKFLLLLKGWVSIGIGIATFNPPLVQRYWKAMQF